MVLAGICVGVFCGVWLGFVGGIAAIFNEVNSPTPDGTRFAVGVARIIFASPFGLIVGGSIAIPGYAIATAKS